MAKNQGDKFLIKRYTLLHIKIPSFHSFQPIHKFQYEREYTYVMLEAPIMFVPIYTSTALRKIVFILEKVI